MADTVETSARDPKERIVRLLNEGTSLILYFMRRLTSILVKTWDIQNLYEESDVPVSDTDGEDSDGK